MMMIGVLFSAKKIAILLTYCVLLHFHLTLEQSVEAFKTENSLDQGCPTVYVKRLLPLM